MRIDEGVEVAKSSKEGKKLVYIVAGACRVDELCDDIRAGASPSSCSRLWHCEKGIHDGDGDVFGEQVEYRATRSKRDRFVVEGCRRPARVRRGRPHRPKFQLEGLS